MWIVCITSVRHVLTVNGYGGRQTKENEKSWCFKGWETLEANITTYVARHSFASVLKKSGVNIALISEALGHSDLATTQIYLDSFDNKQVDEAMKHLL